MAHLSFKSMKITKLYVVESSRPPAEWPWTQDMMSGTETDAISLLKRAVTSGRLISPPSSRSNEQNLIWKVEDYFVGVTVYQGWPLVWSSPAYAKRAYDPLQKNTAPRPGQLPSFDFDGQEIDPWSDEINDFATAVHWVNPRTYQSIVGDGN